MVMIQIRNVPPELHRTLKARAARSGMSLSDFLLAEVELIAKVPTLAELQERLRSLPPVELDRAPHDVLRELRDRGE
jgi:plasmid stability protein